MADEQPKNADELVALLKQKGDLHDPRIEAAFRAISREAFVRDLPTERVYADEAIPLKRDVDGGVISSSSQPGMMVLMLEQLRLQPGHNVLEIGAGSGYNAAIMQHIVGSSGRITSIELDSDIAHLAQDNLQRAMMTHISIVQGDGALGFAPRASYDRIIATVGVWDVPRAWVRQLKPDGILVAPMWLDAFQVSAAFRPRPDDTLESEQNLPCGFVRLRGIAAGPEVSLSIGSTSLRLTGNAVSRLDSARVHALLSDDVYDVVLTYKLTPSAWWSFLPYLILNAPDDYVFVGYSVEDDRQSYGLEGQGFALITAGSAIFVSTRGRGPTRGFGSADAYLALEDQLEQWHKAGRIGGDRLRLRLTPVDRGAPAEVRGRLYRRRDHFMHAWLES